MMRIPSRASGRASPRTIAFNAAFAAVFSFGPTLLVERGWGIERAGSAISIVLWIAVFSVPLGGFLADRFKRPQTMLVTGSLLFAVFEDHMDRVAGAVETACADACHKPMSEMIRQVVQAFVDVKMQRADISVALYKVAPDVGGAALVKQTGSRLRKGIEAMLLTAPDLKLSPDRFAIDMMLSAMSGAMRSALESGASPAMFPHSALS